MTSDRCIDPPPAPAPAGGKLNLTAAAAALHTKHRRHPSAFQRRRFEIRP